MLFFSIITVRFVHLPGSVGCHTISPALTSTDSFVALFGIASLSSSSLSILLPMRGLYFAVLPPFSLILLC